MLDSIDPGSKSIIVLAEYRSGSTALCDFLSKKFKLRNFDEVFHPQLPDKLKWFNLNLSTTNRFVIKILPNHVTNDNIGFIKSLTESNYVIQLTRKDLAKQVLSYYTCMVREHWHFTSNNDQDDYSITLDKNLLLSTLKEIQEFNQTLVDLPFRIDYHVSYEELGEINSQYVRYKKPSNLNEIAHELETIIKGK